MHPGVRLGLISPNNQVYLSTKERSAQTNGQGGSEGNRAKCDSSDGKGERKREKLQHLRKAVKKIKTQDDIRHAFFDPTHGSRIRLSAASLTNPFQAPILRQEVDHDPMPMDAYDGSSEQSRCDIVATNSSALSPRDLPTLHLKANLPLLQPAG